MKIILIIIIQFYWRICPQMRRRSCLFRESCSQHVYRVTSHEGLGAGIRAFLRRFRVCRAGYTIVQRRTGINVRLLDGTMITQNEVSAYVLAPYQHVNREIGDGSTRNNSSLLPAKPTP